MQNTSVVNSLLNADLICQDKRVKMTPLRRRVLQIILESKFPLKAYDILKNIYDDAKPPTVYRALDFLLDNGFVHKLNGMSTYIGCTHPMKNHDCYFLICTKCSAVEECCYDELLQAINKSASQNSFDLQKGTVEITGKCKNCNDKNADQQNNIVINKDIPTEDKFKYINPRRLFDD